jgi:hypothetical protein
MDRDARHVGAGQVGDARATVLQGYMAASCSCFWHQYTVLELSSKYDYAHTLVIEVLHVPKTSRFASIILLGNRACLSWSGGIGEDITPPTTEARILLGGNLGAYFSLLMKSGLFYLMKNHLVPPRLDLIFITISKKMMNGRGCDELPP